jgi:regulator of sirC expression with transglutaminase-like and TPR domain
MLLRPLARLMNLLAAADRQQRVAEAALLLGAADYPEIDVDEHLATLQHYADVVRRRLPTHAKSMDVVQSLNGFLFGELQWRGNSQDYYDPLNSYVHAVMARCVGIPITLSVLYLDIARRLGLRVAGAAFPGHFLVTCETSAATWVVDPYAGGELLDQAALEARLLRVVSDRTQLGLPMSHWLAPADVMTILLRMVRNLKAIYVKNGDSLKALMMCDRLVLLCPDSVSELCERAKLYEHIQRADAACLDYRYIVQLGGDDEIVQFAQARLSALSGAPPLQVVH